MCLATQPRTDSTSWATTCSIGCRRSMSLAICGIRCSNYGFKKNPLTKPREANYKIACLCKFFRLSDHLTCLTADWDLMQDSREQKRQTARQDMFRVDLMTSSLAPSVGF